MDVVLDHIATHTGSSFAVPMGMLSAEPHLLQCRVFREAIAEALGISTADVRLHLLGLGDCRTEPGARLPTALSALVLAVHAYHKKGTSMWRPHRRPAASMRNSRCYSFAGTSRTSSDAEAHAQLRRIPSGRAISLHRPFLCVASALEHMFDCAMWLAPLRAP